MKTVNIAIVASVLAFTMVSPGLASHEDDMKNRGLPAQDYSHILVGGLGEQNQGVGNLELLNPNDYKLKLPKPSDYSNIIIGGQNPGGRDYYTIGEEDLTQQKEIYDRLQAAGLLKDRLDADLAKIRALEEKVNSDTSAKK